MKEILNIGRVFGLVILMHTGLAGVSEVTLQAQTERMPATDQLIASYTHQQGRFIQNMGQLGEAHFMARSGTRDVYFYRDSIVILVYHDAHEMEDAFAPAEDGDRIMSRKITRQGEHAKFRFRSERISLRLPMAITANGPVARGQRGEVVHYFMTTSPSNHHVNVATWDTLQYDDANGCFRLLFTFNDEGLHWHVEDMNYGDSECNAAFRDFDDALHSLFRGSTDPSRRITPMARSADNGIIYSTFLGGSKSDGIGMILPVSEEEFIFIGVTRSPDFPIAGTPFDSTFRGDTSSIYATMVFITRMNIVTNQIIYSTYFGGSDWDGLISASHHNDNIILAGSTWSDDLPVTANAWQPQYRGNGDGYVAALNATGSELVFCSYIGGSGVENLMDMKIDAQGDIVITGLTDSRNYPTTPGVVQDRYGGGDDDIFVTKINHDASELVFSTFIGGEGWDEGRSLSFTPDGNILVAGYTNSNDFPVTQDALYGSRVGGDEGCVFILTPGGRRLMYSSYIAWNVHEAVSDAFLDDKGVLTIFGITTSTDLPVNEFSFQRRKGDYPASKPTVEDFYILKIRPESREILACTYLGGNGRERYPRVFSPLSDGGVLIGGTGASMDYPITTILDTVESFDYAIELSILNKSLSELIYSIRYGGSDYSSLSSAFLNGNELYLSGFTYATDYPITSDALQTDLKGVTDAFFTIIDLSSVISSILPPPALATTAIEAFPQPAGSTLRLVQRLEPAAHATVTLHDNLGRMLRRRTVDAGSDGLLRVELDVADLRPGVYDCRITSGGSSIRRMVSIVR
jgi:hypothetical protein